VNRGRTSGRAALVVALLLAGARAAYAQAGYTPTRENLAARDAFRADRFGMFIHWGVYSVLQDDAWVMNTRHIHVSEYETLAAQFDPVRFDADAWVALAKAAGAPATGTSWRAPRSTATSCASWPTRAGAKA